MSTIVASYALQTWRTATSSSSPCSLSPSGAAQLAKRQEANEIRSPATRPLHAQVACGPCCRPCMPLKSSRRNSNAGHPQASRLLAAAQVSWREQKTCTPHSRSMQQFHLTLSCRPLTCRFCPVVVVAVGARSRPASLAASPHPLAPLQTCAWPCATVRRWPAVLWCAPAASARALWSTA